MKNQEYRVYVLGQDGKPLMPTTRFGKVRRMLKSGMARAVCTKPFTIQLQYEPQTHIVQNVVLGINPGRNDVGVCAVREDGAVLLSVEMQTRNKDVPELQANRKMYRQASRRGERLARKRLAKKYGTLTDRWNPRRLPGCEKSIPVKDICNTESRFVNRIRPTGWLTPTATQLLRTHENIVTLVSEILPVSAVAVEIKRFAFMKLDDPEISKAVCKIESMPGFQSAREAVETIQGKRCPLCGAPIEHVRHVATHSENAINALKKSADLCEDCHDKICRETNTALTRSERKKDHAEASLLNQIIPHFLRRLDTEYPVTVTEGWQTRGFHDIHDFVKKHAVDTYCIACAALNGQTVFDAPAEPLLMKQYRRHDRAKIKAQTQRTYKLNGETVARNRHKAEGQKDDSLVDWYEKMVTEHGRKAASTMRSQLAVLKSSRRYNNTQRIMPGAVFLHDGQRRVLKGQQNRGRYYTFEDTRKGEKPVRASDCILVSANTGLVFI